MTAIEDKIMKTYSELKSEHEGMELFEIDAGKIDGNSCIDVLVYETEDDMEADNDNSLAIYRETVIDDMI